MYLLRGLFGIGLTLLLAAIMLFSPFAGSDMDSARQGSISAKPDLNVILKATAEYSRKLESVIFDFTCLEEIKETIDPLLDIFEPAELAMDRTRVHSLAGQIRKIKASFVHDYQCIRQGGRIRELRILLEEDGEKKHVPNAELKTASFVFGNALLAPISIFAERNQPAYDFAIIGTENINKVQSVVIEAKQKAHADNAKCSYGKAWIDPTTSEILKMEWRETHIGNWDLFEERGKKYLRVPRLTMGTELNIEKSGMRFPNALRIEEAYIDKAGRAFIRTKVDVVYKDFKFFIVEVEIK
jgi:hypothetical protein